MICKKIISFVLLASICSFSGKVSAEMSTKLSNSQLLDIVSGYTSYRIDDEYIDFESFTDEHKKFFSGVYLEHAEKEQVVLSFITNSSNISFEYAVEVDNSGYIDVFVDGVYEKSFDLSKMQEKGTFTYALQGRECSVDIYLPRNGIKIKNFMVDSERTIKSVPERKKAVFYGDSITFGTGLDKISETYVSVLSRMLNYEFVNYGIGGYRFSPNQFVAQHVFKPDIVFVAYGANDSGVSDISGFDRTVESFMNNLRGLYPDQIVYVITPLWTNDATKTGNIGRVREIITEVCKGYNNVQVIDGLSLIPADTKYFSDGLHPNKIGNLVMAKNIAQHIVKDLYTDVTEYGDYDAISGKFTFKDYPADISDGCSFAYYKDAIIGLEGQQAVYENGRFYAPTKLVDILSGKKQIIDYNGNIPEMKVNVELISDKNSSTGWKCRLDFYNLLHEKEIGGTFRFTSPEDFKRVEPVNLEKIPAGGKYTYEFDCSKLDVNKTGYYFDSEIETEDGKVYKNSSYFRGFVENTYTYKPIVIDGVVDEKWERAVKISCDDASAVRAISDWGGKEDMSYEFSSMWDESFLYMYVNVKDNVFSQKNPHNQVWNGDSVQIGLYDNKDGMLLSGYAGTKFEEIALALVEDVPSAYRFGIQTENTTAGLIEEDDSFDIECAKSSDGITYEMKISWKKLFGRDYIPEKNDSIGFSILVNDDDGNGRRGWMEYGGGIGYTKNVNEFVKMQLKSDDEIRIAYNSENVECDVKPVILDDSILIPVRAVFEKLGAKVTWDTNTRTVISKYEDKTVYMKIDSDIIQVNEVDVGIDVPVRIIKDRTFVPIMAVFECYGCHAEWDEETKTVFIEKI